METINRKILVTDSAGFIGSALTLRLLAPGAQSLA
jgi:nucleoside-diphosphate-sugar epimerase